MRTGHGDSVSDDPAGRAAELLEALNRADPGSVWDEVIMPRLDQDERYAVESEMVRRGTFEHAGVGYAISHYSGEWTTLPVEDDLPVDDRSDFGRAVQEASDAQMCGVEPQPVPTAEQSAELRALLAEVRNRHPEARVDVESATGERNDQGALAHQRIVVDSAGSERYAIPIPPDDPAGEYELWCFDGDGEPLAFEWTETADLAAVVEHAVSLAEQRVEDVRNAPPWVPAEIRESRERLAMGELLDSMAESITEASERQPIGQILEAIREKARQIAAAGVGLDHDYTGYRYDSDRKAVSNTARSDLTAAGQVLADARSAATSPEPERGPEFRADELELLARTDQEESQACERADSRHRRPERVAEQPGAGAHLER